MKNKQVIAKHAGRVLKNYRNFQKLSSLSGPFSERARKLIQEIDSIIEKLDDAGRDILTNWYCQKFTQRKSRMRMCEDLNIAIAEYQNIMEQGLLEFARYYRNGVLETLSE